MKVCASAEHHVGLELASVDGLCIGQHQHVRAQLPRRRYGRDAEALQHRRADLDDVGERLTRGIRARCSALSKAICRSTAVLSTDVWQPAGPEHDVHLPHRNVSSLVRSPPRSLQASLHRKNQNTRPKLELPVELARGKFGRGSERWSRHRRSPLPREKVLAAQGKSNSSRARYAGHYPRQHAGVAELRAPARRRSPNGWAMPQSR